MNSILEDCYSQKHPVLFSGNGLPITFQTYLIDIGDDYVLVENRVRPEWIRQFIQSKEWTLHAQMARFFSDEIQSDGEHFIFKLKENSLIQETRKSERFTFSPDDCVICEILNPFDQETILRKTVIDLSASGLSIRTNFNSQVFVSGTNLPSIKVSINGEPFRENKGKVIYTRQLLDLTRQLRSQVGIKIEGP